MGRIAQERNVSQSPLLQWVAVVQAPFVVLVADREEARQGFVPSLIALDHLFFGTLSDPRFLAPGLVVIVGYDIDQFATTDAIHNHGAVGTEPGGSIASQETAGDGVRGYQTAIADLAGEPRRIRAEKTLPGHGMDAVAADDNVGLDLRPVPEPGHRRAFAVLDAD